MLSVRLALLVPVAALALTACGSDDRTGETSTGAPLDLGASAAASTAASAAASSAASAAPNVSAATAVGTARPALDTCVSLPETTDGLYTVADAGTVVVTRDGDRLVLGAVSPAAGWTSTVTDNDDSEIEVEFRMGADELDFQADLDDGRYEIEVCSDDD